MQLVAERQSTATIRAKLNYIVDTGVPPVSYIDWPEEAHKAVPAQYQLHEVAIHDGRPIRDSFELDTHGFEFVTHDTRVKDFTDEGERKRIYDPEVEALIKRTSGASEVVVFDHTVRVGDEATRNATGARPPVKGVHNDYTENSAPQTAARNRRRRGRRAAVAKRFAIIQVWRPIRRKVVIDPLAICDARTIPPTGFILVQRRYPYRTGEVYHIAYNAAHLWYYFPQMERNEALVFKVFDSDPTPPARFTAHTAFDDPNTPADAWPRESIETRTFAFFD